MGDFCEYTKVKIIHVDYLKIDNFKKDKQSNICPKLQGFFEWFKMWQWIVSWVFIVSEIIW